MEIPKDKKLHFGAGFLIALVMMGFGLGSFVALATVSVVAGGKELYDYFFHGTPDINDFFVTVLGALPVVLGSLFYV